MKRTEPRVFQRERTQAEIPPRSGLHNLAPLGIGTASVECLTSYINRLAWMYRVGPRVLVAEAIVPHLKGSHYIRSSLYHLAGFCRRGAMNVNGTGEVPFDWSDALGHLTMRSDLQTLTGNRWASHLPTRGFLRATPAWCSTCIHEWRERGLPIYQPLVWMLQVVTICPQHRRRLEEQCPHCQKSQSVIAVNRTQPGSCTQCKRWLGTPLAAEAPDEIDDELCDWQQWVMHAIEELHQAAASSGSLPWANVSIGLATCVKAVGRVNRITRLADLSDSAFSQWLHGKRIPSFKRFLELCYVLDISPLRLMTAKPADLKKSMRTPRTYRQPRPREVVPARVDRDRTLEMLQAVLNDQEVFLSVSQVAHRLGLGGTTLRGLFPQECALITARYQAARAERAKQKSAQTCEEVRQVTKALHAQGIFPGSNQVKAMLSNPNMLRKAEGLTAWHATRREVGIEP